MTRAKKARAYRPRPAPEPEAEAKCITTRVRIFIGLVVLVGAFTAFVTSGFAEFETHNKGDTGKGEIFEAILTEGPTTIMCHAIEEGTGAVTWTVEKEGKPEEKGGLLFNIEQWGKCSFAAAGGQEGEAKVSGCKMEVKQSGKETKEPIKIVEACTIKVSTCEIKIEPKNNAELKTMDIGVDGESNENTAFGPNVSNIVTEVNKECAPFGIQASKNVTFTGFGELFSVKNAAEIEKFKKIGNGKFNEGGALTKSAQHFEFKGPNGITVFECQEGKFTGELAANGPFVEVKPEEYKTCKEVVNNLGGEVKVNNCLYKYNIGFEVSETEARGDQQMIMGPKTPACEIKLEAGAAEKCEIVIEAQTPHPIASYRTEGLEDLKIENIIGDITYKVTDFTKCDGFTENKTYKDGFLVGDFKIEHVGLE